MAQTKEYAEKLRLVKEKLEEANRKEAKRKRDKAKEPRRPKKHKKTRRAAYIDTDLERRGGNRAIRCGNRYVYE